MAKLLFELQSIISLFRKAKEIFSSRYHFFAIPNYQLDSDIREKEVLLKQMKIVKQKLVKKIKYNHHSLKEV